MADYDAESVKAVALAGWGLAIAMGTYDVPTAQHKAVKILDALVALGWSRHTEVCAGCGIAPCEDGRCACPKPDPYAHLTDDERQTLAVKARDMARSIALTAGLLDEARFNAAIERSKRWQAIADELKSTDG